jgi:two-component system NtrC family sensor kinase
MAAEKRLLVALADSKLRKAIKEEILEPAGYQVVAVASCKAARKNLDAKRPALCFVGDDLKDGDPLELAEEFLMKRPKLPIVLIAQQEHAGQMLQGMRIGIRDYIVPPHNGDVLLAAVERGLQQRKVNESWLAQEAKRQTSPLDQRLSELEEILKRVDDGVLLLDAQHRVVMVNETMRKAFSVEEEVVGASVETLFRDEDILRALKSEGENGHSEISASDGRVFSMQVTQIPEVGTVASLHDISYLKELDRLKGDFVNTVSHDLRSPLTAILGYVELIERAGDVNEQQAQFIERVKVSVESTTDLIENLLNLGRLEVGLVDDMREMQIKDLIDDSLEVFSSLGQEKELTIRFTAGDAISEVVGSRTQLRQVVDNLIGNAVKYTTRGGEIRVSLHEEDRQVIFQVADNGPGIPQSEHKNIFEKFYRARNVNEEVEGTGLGLAIVQTVVDNHGGRIWVESKPRKGSIFTVVLPVAE